MVSISFSVRIALLLNNGDRCIKFWRCLRLLVSGDNCLMKLGTWVMTMRRRRRRAHERCERSGGRGQGGVARKKGNGSSRSTSEGEIRVVVLIVKGETLVESC